jgi:hypothetical protein
MERRPRHRYFLVLSLSLKFVMTPIDRCRMMRSYRNQIESQFSRAPRLNHLPMAAVVLGTLFFLLQQVWNLIFHFSQRSGKTYADQLQDDLKKAQGSSSLPNIGSSIVLIFFFLLEIPEGNVLIFFFLLEIPEGNEDSEYVGLPSFPQPRVDKKAIESLKQDLERQKSTMLLSFVILSLMWRF